VFTYTQKRKGTGVKAVNCPSCGAKLISRYRKGERPTLEIRRKEKEQFLCPFCSTQYTVELDTAPNSSIEFECRKCGVLMRIIRTVKGTTKSKLVKPESLERLPETILKTIQDALPDQPWPKRVHADVATKLGIPIKIVSMAITELIRRGVFKHQFDGKVLVPIDETTPADGVEQKDERSDTQTASEADERS